MGGAYSVAVLFKATVFSLLVFLPVVLIVAGTLVKQEKRKRFLLWCIGIYGTVWTVCALSNTLLLIRYFLKLTH
ncbi:MAG TPA: hypothetical protein VK596_00090 [Edaphobacter sp.]|nr:hypothetical protein [Edaphobacter sp.]